MNLPIVRRIAGLAATASFLLLVIGVAGAWYVNRLQSKSSEILDVNVASIRAAEEVVMHVRETRYELDRSLLSGDDLHVSQALDLRGPLAEWVDEAERLSASTQELESIAAIREGLDQFYGTMERIADTPRTPERDVAIRALEHDVLTGIVLQAANHYLDVNEAQLEESNQMNRAASQRLGLALLLLGSCGAVAGLLAGFSTARGIHRTVLQLTVPIEDAAGKLSQVVGPLSVTASPELEDLEDVLQRLSSEVGAVVEKLQESHREVIRADQLAAVGQLAAGLAHELRNPLMCMKVLVQDARRAGSNGLDDRDLEVIDEEIIRMENLVEEFVDFAGPAKISKERLDLRDLTEQTVAFLAPQAARRGIRVEHRLPAEPLEVVADKALLRQMLLNLLLNALDAVNNHGTIEIQARTEAEDPDDGGTMLSAGRVVLEITDDGPGLPSGSESRIFEPFFSTKETGLGLGLATSRRIVESHGGCITAANRPSGGAAITVQLPLPTPGEPSAGFEPIGHANVVCREAG